MADIKLNIYDKNKIIKTYSTKSFYITTGTVEEIFKLVDVDTLLGNLQDNNKLGQEVLKICIKGFSKFKDTILEIFDGMTEDEWKNTHINEVARMIFLILRDALTSLNNIETDEKN